MWSLLPTTPAKIIAGVADTSEQLITGVVDTYYKHIVVDISVKKETLWCKNHENPNDLKSHSWDTQGPRGL
jgi:hypothetical protein